MYHYIYPFSRNCQNIRGFMVQTFHSRKFASIEDLTVQKALKSNVISVVIPALNEAATIGPIISRIRSVLMEKSGFVDEIVVMDGISEDETAKVALEAGAEVYNIADVEPSVLHRGKGVAMWKSQFVTRGDIIIFIDSDILDFDERFICGLAGPLLYHDELYFAKAFYKRPLLLGTGIYENQGGRVTEIMVRPLLSSLVSGIGSSLPASGRRVCSAAKSHGESSILVGLRSGNRVALRHFLFSWTFPYCTGRYGKEVSP